MDGNTLFLRLEGPMQAWGDNQAKFVVRRSAQAPTKSAIIGMLCATKGLNRTAALDHLESLSKLRVGIRIDRPGTRWWDYHTVGAGMKMPIAEKEGKTKSGAMLTRREYLCDASFLVAIQGNTELIAELYEAVQHPVWPIFLGRKNCPPSLPILEKTPTGNFNSLEQALCSIPWKRRYRGEQPPGQVDMLLEWRKSDPESPPPEDAQVWHDVPVCFDPPAHHPRLVIQRQFKVGKDCKISVDGEPIQQKTKSPLRSRADYTNSEYKKARLKRLESDRHLCVFCKSPATTVQHITYERAGGGEIQDDLRALCRLCHDAITMLEYGHGMGMERINPEDTNWRQAIIAKRQEIVEFRSMETRRRHLNAKEVE
jgi:CRISPR system Cascade subunit CasD